jgi:hypothetical protein
MHTAALPFAVTCFFAKEFRHHFFDVHSLAYGLTVAAVCLGNHVFFFKGGADASAGRFLANAEMGRSVDLTKNKKPRGGFFKYSGLYHF